MNYDTGPRCAALPCLPMDRNGEDGVDVGHHCFEVLRVLLETHLREHQGLSDVYTRKESSQLTYTTPQLHMYFSLKDCCTPYLPAQTP